LAGLLEGDGHISIPALFKNSILNRILNPRIVFTAHINNLALYAFIQSELGGIGRFQITGNNSNTLRYIIGDIKGLQLLIKLMHGKLRTPKNITFNNLITFINNKYSLNILESILDTSNFDSNS
jgi:LAGLIDADG endonuclease